MSDPMTTEQQIAAALKRMGISIPERPELHPKDRFLLREKHRRNSPTTDEEAHGSKSDEWVANAVRMLMRNDIDHEAICVAARDRIMRLSLQVESLQSLHDLSQEALGTANATIAELRRDAARLKDDYNTILDSHTEVVNELRELRASTPAPPSVSRVSVDSAFENQKCPFTGRVYFMHIDHDELGHVPTYGGPFDSYTIPAPDEDGNLHCERYDHDEGTWVDGGEPTGLMVISESEYAAALRPAPAPAEQAQTCDCEPTHMPYCATRSTATK
jgi:hypothetical protein